MIRAGSDNARRSLVPVPTDAERDGFASFLAGWMATAAERRIRRTTGTMPQEVER
jgi:hypothetical protein